jgi:hypothetical protein
MLWGATNTAMQAAWIAEVEAHVEGSNLDLRAEPVGERDVVITGPQEDLDALMRSVIARSLPVR